MPFVEGLFGFCTIAFLADIPQVGTIRIVGVCVLPLGEWGLACGTCECRPQVFDMVTADSDVLIGVEMSGCLAAKMTFNHGPPPQPDRLDRFVFDICHVVGIDS